MHFDWYQATIPAKEELISGFLTEGGFAASSEVGPGGGRGYRYIERFVDQDGDTLGYLRFGSSTASPSLQFSGERASEMAGHLREHFPDHSVSRCDIAFDRTGKGGMRKARSTVKAEGAKYRVTSGYGIIPDDRSKGKTFYVGSPKSAAMCRIYQKDLELSAKGRLPEGYIPDPDKFRVEFQFRPNTRDDAGMFSKLKMEGILAWSPWVKAAVTSLIKLELPEVERAPHLTSDLDRTFHHLTSQYASFAIKWGMRECNRHGQIGASEEEALDMFAEAMCMRMLQNINDKREREESKSRRAS